MAFTTELGLEKVTDGQKDTGDSLNTNAEIIDLGYTRYFPLAENGVVGEIFYKNSSGDAAKAKADDITTIQPILGFLTIAGSTTDDRRYQAFGKLVKAGWALTANSIYYLSAATAGAITTTKPVKPNVAIQIGYTGDATTTLYIDIKQEQYFYYDTTNSYLRYGDQAITSVLFDSTTTENGFIVAVANQARLVCQGSTSGALILVDAGAPADHKIFEIIAEGSLTGIRALKDDGTVQATFMIFSHDASTIKLNVDTTLGPGASLNLEEDITFTGATSENIINFPNNLALGLLIKGGGNEYMRFISTSGSESIDIFVDVGFNDKNITGVALMVAGDVDVTGFFSHTAAVLITIASGVVTAARTYHAIGTQSGAGTDDLDTVNGGTEGDILVLRAADSAQTVVCKNATGNLYLAGDFSLDHTRDRITLMKQSSWWVEMSRSDNS